MSWARAGIKEWWGFADGKIERKRLGRYLKLEERFGKEWQPGEELSRPDVLAVL